MAASLPELQIIPIWAFPMTTENHKAASLIQSGKMRKTFKNKEGVRYSLDVPIMFITEFQDNFDPKYSVINTFGRMDPIVNYQGTSRRIIIGIEIDDSSTGERVHKTMKKMTYPVYEAAGGIKNALTIQRAPLVMVSFGNLVQDPVTAGHMLCVLENYAMTPTVGFTPLDSPLVRFGGGDSRVKGNGLTEFQKYNFKFDLIPLHSTSPGFAEDSSGQFDWIGGDDF